MQKTKFNLMSPEDQAQAMTVICNIQSAEFNLLGKSSKFNQLNKYSLDELRQMQDELIVKYNSKLATINEILDHYLICAIWTDEEQLREDHPNADLTVSNIHPTSRLKARNDIIKFLELVGDAVNEIIPEQIGHDLWLTRNGHGTGFWDRGHEEEKSKILCDACKELKGADIYLGDDAMLHFS